MNASTAHCIIEQVTPGQPSRWFVSDCGPFGPSPIEVVSRQDAERLLFKLLNLTREHTESGIRRNKTKLALRTFARCGDWLAVPVQIPTVSPVYGEFEVARIFVKYDHDTLGESVLGFTTEYPEQFFGDCNKEVALSPILSPSTIQSFGVGL